MPTSDLSATRVSGAVDGLGAENGPAERPPSSIPLAA